MSTRRFHKAGNQFVVDKIIELNARTSSTVSSIVNSVTAKSTSKNLTSLQSSLAALTSDGVISSSEKTGLKREWQSLLSAYLSVAADIVLYDDLAELDIVSELSEAYAALAELMDAILADMDEDYTGDGIDELTDYFVTLWELITEAQQLVNAEVAEASWAQYHTIRVSGDYSGGKLSTALEAYISYEGEELTDSEYLTGYTWTRLDNFDEGSEDDTWDDIDHAVKSLTILNTMLPVDGTRFQITWTDREGEEDDDYHLLATIIEIPWGTLVKYAWCTATTTSELLEQEEAGEFSWVWGEGDFDSQPDDDSMRLWRAQSTDNGASWSYYIANGVKGEDGESPIFQYKWSHSFYDAEDWHTVLTYGTDVVTVALDSGTSIVFTLQNDDSEWFDYVPDEPDDRPCLWGRCWNFQTEVWDMYRLTGNPGTEPKTMTIGLDTHAVPLDEYGLTEAGVTVTATCKMTGITPYTEPAWLMSDGLEGFLSSYSSSVLTEDDNGYDEAAVTSVLVMEMAEGMAFTSGYVYCRVTDTEEDLSQGTTSAGSTYQSIQAKFHGVQEGSSAKMVTVGASPSSFLLDEYGMTESQEVTFEARLINLNGVNLDGSETSGGWVFSPADTGYITWAEDGLTLTAAVAAGLSLSEMYAYYTYTEDGVTYTSYTCQLAGSRDGASAKGLTFELSQAVVSLTSGGLTESSTAITATATLQNITGTVYWSYSSELAAILSSAPSSGEEIEMVFAQGVSFTSGYLYCYVDDTSSSSVTRYTANSKSIVGVRNGEAAKTYTLTASSSSYHTDQDGLTTGDGIELTLAIQNIDISSVSWTMSSGLSGLAALGDVTVTEESGVTTYSVTLTFATGESASGTCYVYAVVSDTDGNTYTSNKCSFGAVQDGADAARLSLEAEPSSYTLTSRGQTPIDESQTIKVTATASNLSGGSLSWEVEGYAYDDDGVTELSPYDYQGLEDTLSLEKSSDGGYILISIPRGWLRLELIRVTCAYNGGTADASAELVLSGIVTGEAEPVYLGSYTDEDSGTEALRLEYLSENVTKTDAGPLIYGDHALVNGVAYYVNSELAWEMADGSTPADIYYKVLMDCLADAVETPDADSMSVTQLWAQSLAVYNAFIESLTALSLQVGAGDASEYDEDGEQTSEGSGFLARIMDYDGNGNKLSTPVFDVWYGGKCIFKIAPSSGRVFLGEPDWSSLDDNGEPESPASGFMYTPKSEDENGSIQGGTLISKDEGIVINADGTLDIGGGFHIGGDGIIEGALSITGNIANGVFIAREGADADSGESYEKTFASSTTMASTMYSYYGGGYTKPVTVECNGTTTECYMLCEKSNGAYRYAYKNSSEDDTEYLYYSSSIPAVSFYADSAATSAIKLSALGMSVKADTSDAGTSVRSGVYSWTSYPSSTYYLYYSYAEGAITYSYSKYAVTITSYDTEALFRILSMPQGSAALDGSTEGADSNEDEGRLWVDDNGYIHWWSPANGITT